MGFDTDGFVLRAPRTAPGNARTTGDADTGVLRDVRGLPGAYSVPGVFVEPAADQYRAAVLLNPEPLETQEFLLWAANSSSLTVLETTDWTVTADDPTGSTTRPTGTLDVYNAVSLLTERDGSDRLVVEDTGGRALAEVRLIHIQRGDDPSGSDIIEVGPDVAVPFATGTDADAGLIVLPASIVGDAMAPLAGTLNGGVSKRRGDAILRVDYIVAAARFWWTRNDSTVTRFGWNGKAQRWGAFKGSPPKNLGILIEGGTYTAIPRPTRFTAGDTLPGNSAASDEFALIRLGVFPDRTAAVPDVLVVPDTLIEEGYNFISATPDAVIGETNGIIVFNDYPPAGGSYVELNAGRTVWYSPESFEENSDGKLGALIAAADVPLFMSPIPGPTDRPFIRLGFRRYMLLQREDNDAALDALVASNPSDIPVGTVAWSLTTGKLKFSTTDIEKADPDEPGFDIRFLGAQVYYDGVSLTTKSLGTRAPVQLQDKDGAADTIGAFNTLYIPQAASLPSPGTSGVLHIADGSGTKPNSGTPAYRFDGTGLIRRIEGVGDTILFAPGGVIEEIEIVDLEKDLPALPFLIKKGKAWVSRQINQDGSTAGSRVSLGLKDRARFGGQAMYFLQAEVQPAVYTKEATLYSRELEPFTLTGDETLAVGLDGTPELWASAAMVAAALPVGRTAFTAQEVADDFNLSLTGSPASVFRGRVVLSASTSVEIGWGTVTPPANLESRDLAGCAALGFLPGWLAIEGSDNYLPDHGGGLGVFRSPQNLDRSKTIPDIKNRGRFNSTLLTDSVIASQYFNLDFPPLRDVAGYDDDLFFLLVDGLNFSLKKSLVDVLYDFGNSRIAWLGQGKAGGPIEQATTAINLGNPGVVADTLHPSVAAGNGLLLSPDGGAYSLLKEGQDFLLPANGAPGLAYIIENFGGTVGTGGAGGFSSGDVTFIDPNAKFLTAGIDPITKAEIPVPAGYLLQILTGDSEGTYVVAAAATTDTTLTIEAAVPFLSTETFAAWRLLSGFETDVYDPGVVADVQYTNFNHLPEEPFKVRALSSTGLVPPDAGTQAGDRNAAVMTEALQSARLLSIRVGLNPGSPELGLVGLNQEFLGTMANGALSVPDTLSDHFANGDFSIRVGTSLYTHDPLTGDGLLDPVVGALPSSVAGDVVQYSTSGPDKGKLLFGDGTLTNLDTSDVYYVEEFLTPSVLAAGTVEYSPATGDLNFSDTDMGLYAGTVAYFVEQMVTEQRQDVAMSPMAGSFYFNRPLRDGQVVEVSYFVADSQQNLAVDDEGVPLPEITEFLPLFVRQEKATLVDAHTYAINPTGRTILDDINPQFWIGVNLQNYAGRNEASIDAALSQAKFINAVDPAETVLVNYAVLEAFGGEQTYSTSTLPVWRPPFFLEADTSTFTLETDRTGDVVPGKIMRLGASPLYIKSSVYDAGTDLTTVTIFPTPDNEVGTRAPGNDLLNLLTDVPVTADVDGTPTAGVPGFLMLLMALFEPVAKGSTSIIFKGDVTRFTVAGHLLEMGGLPFIIAGATLSDDGLTTKVDLTNPLSTGFDPTIDAVKISVRAIYPPLPKEFLGINPLVEDEGYDLILFGETDTTGTELPGRTLRPNIDYSLDPSTGAIVFICPPQNGLRPTQKLVLSYVKQTVLGPFLKDGIIGYPRFSAQYGHVTTPSEGNGVLNATLVAKYTYRNPDSFYYRSVPLQTYMGEVSQIAAQRLASGSGGPMITSGASQENFDQGSLSLLSGRRNLVDQDRAARTFLTLYNETIVAFEQVLETLNGQVIGDHDGKFRFFVGRDKTYAPPGYEDGITGVMNPRNIWAEVFLAAQGDIHLTELDIIVDPETATQIPYTVPEAKALEVDGDIMDPSLQEFYLSFQSSSIQNDMDDRVVTRRLRPRMAKQAGLPKMRGLGDYRGMWEPSRYSRLFPETALAFTTTYPGLLPDLIAGDPGVYSFRRMVEPPKFFKGESAVYGSTFKQPIGSVSNPAIGVIANVTDAVIRDRKARARVWAYSETGFPDLGDGSVTGPAVIATPLFLKDFPIDVNTGLPDLTRLLSNASAYPGDNDLADLGTGDQELSTGPWRAYNRDKSVGPKVMDQVSIGRPTGELIGLGDANNKISSFFDLARPLDVDLYKGVFVFEIKFGCVITFCEGGKLLSPPPTEITDPDQILMLGSGNLEGEPMTLSQGDTIYVGVPDSNDSDAKLDGTDPEADQDAQDEMAAGKPNYRRGFDIGLRKGGGEFLDLSLPSIKDPSFPLKEMLNQKGPDPMTTIEADVEFTNVSRDPFNFPALQGLPTNDSGDYGIPYLSFGNTELDRLIAVQCTFSAIVQTDGTGSESVYPSEIVGNTAIVQSVWNIPTVGEPPAALITGQNLSPGWSAGSGEGDPAEYDLLLMQTNHPTMDEGAEGIQAVGSIDGATGLIEPPRFVTQSLVGERIQYEFINAMAYFTVFGGPDGVIVDDNGVDTILDFTAISPFILNDGAGGTTGGLNDIVSNGVGAYPNNNIISIDLRDKTTGLVLENILIQGSGVTAGLGSGILLSVPEFGGASNQILILRGITGVVDPSLLGGVFPTTIPANVTLTVNTMTAGAAPNPNGSDTGWISSDRLTFNEGYDFRSVVERGVTFGTSTVAMQSLLRVSLVANDAGQVSVNDWDEVNGGDPFTFLSRDGTGSIGTWNGSSLGTVKVMGFEGHGDGFGNPAPFDASGITFSAIPSSFTSSTGVICNGTTTTEDGTNYLSGDTLLPSWTITGSFNNIEMGDILIIDKSALGAAAIKAGTYLIRHAVTEGANATAPRGAFEPGSREVFATFDTKIGGRWLDFRFPQVQSVSWAATSSGTLVVDRITTVPDSPSGYDFPTTGTVWVLDSTTDYDTAVGATYSSAPTIAGNGNVTFVLDDASAIDGSGAGISNAAFAAAVKNRAKVTGMTYIPIKQFEAGMPEHNTVGSVEYDGTVPAGPFTIGGFVGISIENAGGVKENFDEGGSLVDSLSGPGAGDLSVAVSGSGVTTASPLSITSSRTTVVYDNVPVYLDLSFLNTAKWNNIHGATGTSIKALVVGDILVTEDTPGLAGYLAQSGIFTEPSWARPTQDLQNGEAKVVDAAHTPVSAGTVGMRDAGGFFGGTEEDVHFIVKRIRRFHDVMDGIADNLGPLRYAYEIRRGAVASYDDSVPSRPTLQLGSPATQLGNLDDEDVNVNSGDIVRVFNSDGVLKDSAEISVVTSFNSVALAPPGFANYSPVGGDAVEIYLRKPPVPHEQSNEQLLALITDQVIYETTAIPNSVGGKVADWNELRDSDSSVNYATLGVREGDIVIVDPAGDLAGPGGQATPPERGSRPIGDDSYTDGVTPRSKHQAGGPSKLDDNRGWYRVGEVDPAGEFLEVIGTTEFTGSDGTPMVFGASAPTDQRYVVYPDITGSGTSEGGMSPTEGQMSLRPTLEADVDDSYLDNFFSIEPFSYKIIRPSSLFSDEAIDLVLMNRERIFSWMEEIASAQSGSKGGAYWDFQKDEHISDLGSPTDGDAGLGVANNVYITSQSGHVEVAPYENTSDCLSVLGRRYWGFDTRLDNEGPPGSSDYYASLESDNSASTYTVGSGRPVLPDLVDGVLDRIDRFRSQRFAWIKFRTDRVNGSLMAIERFDQELPRKLQEQEDLLRLQEGLDST